MNISLQDILTEDFIQRFQESFAFSTGFGVVFVDLNGNHIGPGSNFSKFCQEINKSEEGAAYCANTNREAIQLALQSKKPSIYICHAGLVNIEIPLTFEGNYIGAITAGQVRCSDLNEFPQDPTEKSFQWMETKEASDYFKSIKTLTKQEIEATAISLENIANYIIQTVMVNKLQERLAEEQRVRLESEKKQIEMEHRLKLAELDALQKQVTPHFIFNVLNSISRLISLNEHKSAKNMLDAFASMLRYTLYDTNSSISLKQELNYIKHYLNVQKLRFSERLDFELIEDNELQDVPIPYFSLQPIVENAIEHGILSKESGGFLKINCQKEHDTVLIEIIDNGTGMDQTQLNEIERTIHADFQEGNNNVGLRNAYRRLQMMYGDHFHFKLKSKPGIGTTVSLKIHQIIAPC